jgi:ABC-type transport system involved in multi-copper enzyme maturation permease subunit
MSSVLRDLGTWFWRLGPANPILVRVVHAGGRRKQHLILRAGYLVALASIVVIGVLVKQSGETSLAGLAKNATQVFKMVAWIQLLLVSIIAPIFTAAAITQEKDSQTFSILLSTPLTNGQIVLGSLLSRLFFVFVLLAAGVPLFCIMMVYGGVTGGEIALSSAIAAATALLTGAIAISISVVRIGTGRTIFSYYLAIALYLIVLYGVSSIPAMIPPEAPTSPTSGGRMSWLAALHPFLALDVVLGKTPAPDPGAVAHHGFPWRYLLAYPQESYLVWTVIASCLLILFSLFFVRRSALEGEMSWLRRATEALRLSRRRSEQTRAPRRVAHNPIKWRESATSASATGGNLSRWGLFAIGLAVGVAVLIAYGNGAMSVTTARTALFGIVLIELCITLFISTAAAATSMTREKEANTMELILATPLTSRYIIWGKIYGLITAAWPMLLVPVLTVALFVVFQLLMGKGEPVVYPEALITLPLLCVAFTAFVCVIGLRQSINQKKTLAAVFVSMSVVIFVFAILGGCLGTVFHSPELPQMTAALWPAGPYTAVYIAIDPGAALSPYGANIDPAVLSNCRIITVLGSICMAAIYCFIVGLMHKSMVHGFDMVIRKQSA